MINERTERIRALLEQVRPRITAERYDDVVHNLQEEEWHLALLLLAEYLDEQDSKLNPTEWTEFAELATLVHLDASGYNHIRSQVT